MNSNAEVFALFLWFGGLAVYFWKPSTDRHQLVYQAAAVTLWLGLAVWFPHLRTWQYALASALFAAPFLFRLVQHRGRLRSL
jgi:hypothetical protein